MTTDPPPCRCGHEPWRHRAVMPVLARYDGRGVVEGRLGNCEADVEQPGWTIPFPCRCRQYEPTVSEGLWR